MRLIFLLALTAVLASPQVVTERMKRGRQIIDEAIAALGGDKFLALQTKIEKGRIASFYQAQLSGFSRATIYTKYLIAPPEPDPSKIYLRERQAFGKDEKWSVLFNEDGGWEVTFRGARPLDEEVLKQYRERRRNDIFYLLLRRLHEPGMLFERVGTEVVDNYPMEVVDITDGNNNVVTVYFHYDSKLPARQRYDRRDKRRVRHVEETIFDKYRDFDGVKLPMVIERYRDDQKIFSMYAESIEVNVPLTDDEIGLPADIKVLKRQQ